MNFRETIDRQFLLLCILLGLSLGGHAQEATGRVYVRNNPLGTGIAVRWAGPEISYPEGINIYRKEGRKSWTLITPNPILPPTAIPNDGSLSDNSSAIFESFLQTDHQEFVEGFGGILTLMESLKDYPLALALRIAYNDEQAEPGKNYTYKVEAILKGKPVLLGESEKITCADYVPFPAPAGLSFERKRRRTFIKWENDPVHFYAYNFYVRNEAETTFTIHTREIGSDYLSEKKDWFFDLPTDKDSTYFIKVEALDYFGGKSEMSEELAVAIQDFDPTSPPELIVSADAAASTNSLSWQRPPELDLRGYDIFRMQEGVDTTFIKLNQSTIPPDDTLYQDKVRGPGAYTYRVIALDEAGNPAPSLPETGEIRDITPPPVPDFVNIFPDTGLFVIRWQPVKADDLKGYVVMRSVADEDNSDNRYMPASEVLDTNYFAEPISPNVSAPFVYVVRSVDSLLNYSTNSREVVGKLPDVTPPVAPMIREVKDEAGALRIVWMENVERDLKGYQIYKRIEGDTADFQRLNLSLVPKDINAYTDKSVERGKSYEYRVEAIDFSDLISPSSNIATGKVPFLPLNGEIEILKQKFSPTRSEFILSWSGDKLSQEPVVGFGVFRSVQGGKALQRGKVNTKTEFREKLSQPGTYAYHIRAYGERGNVLHSEIITIEVEAE